jgi:hypothetical protein
VIEQQEQIIESFTKLENELRITNKNDAIQTVVSSIGESTANLPRNLIAKIGRHHNTNHAQQTETNKGMAKWMFILALSIIYQYIIR